MMELRSFLLSNEAGDEICITNYGARIVQWYTVVDGEERDIVLGYSTLAKYIDDSSYLGAVVGPYANRIAQSSCVIEDEVVNLNANEGVNHLHGGMDALSDILWHVDSQEEQELRLSCKLEDGFNGYPGTTDFSVIYTLTDESTLQVDFYATTEKPTIIGPTCHPYFNLAGVENCANEHLLQVNADYYTEVDERAIPTGNVLPVDETRFDFTKLRILKHDDDRDSINHNFVMNKREDRQAVLISPDKKLQLHVESDYPGMQVYTGDYLEGEFSSKQGICLEPQFYPDSPNQQDFPFYLTTPEKPFSINIEYKLVKPNV